MSLDVFDLRAIRHAIEAVEGTPESLTAGDAIQIINGEGQISVDQLERELDRPAGGARPYIPIKRRVMVTGEVELAGAANAGDAAPISGLLRNMGHTETLNVGPPLNAEYTPVLKGFPSATFYFYHSGETLQAAGGRGRFTSLDLAINAFPKAGIELLGKLQGVAEEAVPTDDLSAFQTPIVGVESNMTVELGGVALDAVSLSLDLGVSLGMVYHTEASVSRHSARAVTGTLRVYRPTQSKAHIRQMAEKQTLQTLLVDYVTGTAAKDLSLEAPSVQIGEPQNAELDGLRVWDIPIRLLPDAGNDDYTLRFGSRT